MIACVSISMLANGGAAPVGLELNTAAPLPDHYFTDSGHKTTRWQCLYRRFVQCVEEETGRPSFYTVYGFYQWQSLRVEDRQQS